MKKLIAIVCILMLNHIVLEAQVYCVPTFANGCTNWKNTAITLNTINWTAPATCTTWDFTATSTNVTAGVPEAMTVTNGAYCGTSVWLDLNSDGDFDDLNENLYSIYTANANNVYSFNITVPISTPNGLYRMRVFAHWGSDGVTSVNGFGGCGAYQYGNYQDFTLNVGGIAPCAVPTGIAPSAITNTSATVSWNAVAGVVGYEYAVNTTFANPLSGTPTTTLSYNANSLAPNTTYYIHLRSDCGASNFSSWAIDSFTTTNVCNPATALTASAITSTTATVSWAGTAAATGYEYAIDNSAAAPISGTAIAATTYNATALLPATLYYLHVRVNCGNNNFSTWTTIPFTTLAACNAPANLSISNLTAVSANISYNTVAGAANYEYVLNNLATNPPGAGTPFAATTYNALGLTPTTLYYFHVRTHCGSANYSPWATISFTTNTANAVSDKNLDYFKFTISPNPCSGNLQISLNEKREHATFKISSMLGKTLQVIDMNAMKINVDLSKYTNGIYLIQYQDEHVIQTSSIIIQKN